MSSKNRIKNRFSDLKRDGRSGLVTFVTAGDPDLLTSLKIIKGLPEAGADFIEIGMPFSDPMADGPSIQLSSKRALMGGVSLKKVLDLVKDFRSKDSETPIILMGYYNPIFIYGINEFLSDAATVGIDGLIIVDLPPEEETELCLPAKKAGIDFIYLATPTTDSRRISKVLKNASGFVYYVSIAGITGTKSAGIDEIKSAVSNLRKNTNLPIGVGFGITTPRQASEIAKIADAVVVGSALVNIVRDNLDKIGKAGPNLIGEVLSLVNDLSVGVKNNRKIKNNEKAIT